MKIICAITVAFFTYTFGWSQTTVSTYAGTGIAGLTNGNLTSAQFKQSFGICRDRFGNMFIADNGNNCIRKISAAGVVSTYAGSATAGYLDGNADSALFNAPAGVCADDSGNVYVADFLNQRIRKISISGTVSTIAGSGTAGLLDGPPDSARFNYPRGICIDKNYNIYVGDSWNHRVRKIAPNGTVSTYAGGGTVIGVQSVGGYVDAQDTAARFYTPCGLSVDNTGNVFVADAYTHRIRKIDTSGMVSTVVGSGPVGQGQGSYLDSTALNARLNVPTEVFIDSLGNLYIGDTFSNRVRKMESASGAVTSLGGTGNAGFVNGPGSTASFNYPRGVIAYTDGRVYVVDYGNHCIRLIVPSSAGIEDLENTIPLTVFPNPFSSETTIQTVNSLKDVRLILYNTSGQKTHDIKGISGQTITLQRSNLPAGVYFMQLLQGGKIIATEKLTVTN